MTRASVAEGPLAGKVALVTGAANGIGKAVTERFLRDGATVVGADLDPTGLDDLRGRWGDRLVPVECDVTDEASMAAACAVGVDHGGLHIAVANAGKGTYSEIVDHDLASFREIVDLCLIGVFLTLKHAGRVMHDGGSIITIASLNAVQPSAGMSAYCAAKAGATMISDVAAMELGGRGIRVNTVAPGLVRTAATASFWALPGVVDDFVDNTTVGRFAEPVDVANVVAFLAGPESGFVSASFYSVDGGATTKRYADLPAAIRRATTGG